jgi:hypothetical protein
MTFPGVLRHNLGLKLASVLLGVLVYLHVYTDRVHEHEFSLPIELTRKPDSLAVVGSPPARAAVLFRGRGKELLKLRWRTPVVEVDLTGAGGGRFDHSLSVADVRMPASSGAAPVAIVDPRRVTLDLDRMATRRLPVAIRLSGTLPPGYLIRQTRVDPSHVAVRGPSRILAREDSLDVGPIELSGLRGRAEGLFPVHLGSPELRAAPAQVRVELGVERAATREIEGVPVRVLVDNGLSGRAEPDHASVRVSGPRERTEAATPARLRLVVDARGLGPGEHELQGRTDTLGSLVVTPGPGRFKVWLELQASRRGRRP